MASEEYSEAYNDGSFWQKVTSYALAAGREVIEKALTLYFCLQDSDTPLWAKSIIVGTLGYFIVPLDAIPDLTLLVGYGDDLGALALALAMVAAHIKSEHREMAQERLRLWFG